MRHLAGCRLRESSVLTVMRVNIHPLHGHDPTTFEAWSGPDIGEPAHPTSFGKTKKSVPVTDVFMSCLLTCWSLHSISGR